MFAFNEKLTLTSYVSKKNKALILLSTEHHSKALIRELNNKPEIIKTYNESKGGVDAFGQLLE